MGKQQQKKPTANADKFFAFGIDDNGKPRGARFAEFNERALNFINELKLTGVFPASRAFAEIAAKLPQGRLYSSGKGFVPNVRRDLIEKLEAALVVPGDESQTHRPAAPPEGQSDEATVRTISPITSGLPRSWESVGVGHVAQLQACVVATVLAVRARRRNARRAARAPRPPVPRQLERFSD